MRKNTLLLLQLIFTEDIKKKKKIEKNDKNKKDKDNKNWEMNYW